MKLLASLAITTALIASPVSASTIYLTEDNSGGQLGGNLPIPGYGTVQVTTVGSDLEFQMALAPNWSVDTGVHHAIAFNISLAGLQISGSSGGLTPLAVPFVQAAGNSFVNPGFPGPLNYAIDCVGGGNGANSCNHASSLTFFVLGGAAALNSDIDFSADILSSLTGGTGVVGGEASPVPASVAGGGLPGLAAMLLALTFLARRRQKSNQSGETAT